MDWLSLLVPIAYLSILLGSLATFSYLYRTRLAAKAAALAPWFPPHLQRNVYLSLLELHATEKIPDSILRAALFKRAAEDIHRVVALRNAKPALSQLLQRGAVGDELWQRFQFAEKEMEMELKDVVQEANALAPGGLWGQTIFQSAGEAAHNEVLRKNLAKIESRRTVERERWEKQRETVREEFLKELEGDGKKGSDDDAVLVDPEAAVEATPEPSGSAKKKKGKK